MTSALVLASLAALSLADALRDEAGGGPVLLVNRVKGGIEARSPDGRFSREILANGFGIEYDAALELLWVVRDDQLSVLDLREVAPAPIPIADYVRGMRVVRRGRRHDPGLYVRWTRRPTVRYRKLTMEDISELDYMEEAEIAAWNRKMATAAKRVRLVGASWLADNARRPARRTSWRRQRFGPRLRGVALAPCSGTCGRAARVAPSGLVFVVTGDQADHDSEWVGCDLYNPRTRRWADPRQLDGRTWGTTTSGDASGPTCAARFDATGSAYLLLWNVCQACGGCIDMFRGDGRAIGWLDPGVELVPPYPQARPRG